jgi:carbon storage regulator
MLVLTRKCEEKITIGKNKEIVITILKVKGENVSVGIKAPENYPIWRNELINNEEAPQEIANNANENTVMHENERAIAPVA